MTVLLAVCVTRRLVRHVPSEAAQAEAEFLRELDHAIQQVTDAPAQWPRYIAGTQRYVFPTYPYSLVYFVENDVINVVAVAHDKKRPGYWRKRLRKGR
jgi:plasmid stabilization system protein ParE